ncbi:TIGR02300 family protein [Caenispirillum salinarum]|uniref:TIGR02300 family protein n=1 Tax=Caenispirillum salinarum TaxID=859058 RepID=UPI00384FA710
MAKPEWGTKRTCTHCGARFYDLNKRPIICPKCEAENEAEVAPKLRRSKDSKVAKPTKAVAKPAAAEEEEDYEAESENEDTDEDVIEDTNDLGEDDEDMAEVMEHVESEEEDT